MNIVQVAVGETKIPAEKGGGNEALILNLARELAKMGHRVIILDRKYSKSDPNAEFVEGIKIIRLNAMKFPFIEMRRIPKLANLISVLNITLNQFTFSLQVKRYLKINQDNDIVHTYFSVTVLVLGLVNKKLRTKIVYTPISNRREKSSPSFVDKVTLALENHAVKCVRKVTIESESARMRLIRDTKLNPQVVDFVPLCVDTDRFNPDLDVGDIRAKYGLAERFTILFVGRIHPDKGVEYLVRAANIVVNEFGYENTMFMLVGPAEEIGPRERGHSSYVAKIKQLIKEYGLEHEVKLVGAVPIDDLRKLYCTCSITVVPSVVDLGPQTPLEAMASGKPVIGTKVGTIPMHIRQNLNGLLVDPADERQLAMAIMCLIDDPTKAKEMGIYSRKFAESEYAPVKIARRFITAYQLKNEH